MSGYREALEAAGATVTAFAEFGTYQGDWVARVGDTYVTGSYGSCTGCDAFESEFGYGSKCDDHRYAYEREACTKCDEMKATYDARLADFGARYLDGAMTADELRKQFAGDIDWDTDVPTVLAWIDEQEKA